MEGMGMVWVQEKEEEAEEAGVMEEEVVETVVEEEAMGVEEEEVVMEVEAVVEAVVTRLSLAIQAVAETTPHLVKTVSPVPKPNAPR